MGGHNLISLYKSNRWVFFHLLWAIGFFSLFPQFNAHPEAPKVLAFYYTWYGTPEVRGSWMHWNEGGHRPDQTLATGLPDTGTTHHPASGLYDSHDTTTIQRHLRESRMMGIDALISTWWRQGDGHDRAFRLLLEQIEETDSTIRACAYLEVAQDAAGAIDDIQYLVREYGGHPAYFRDSGNRPVIFIYGRAMNSLTVDQWRKVTTEVGSGSRCLLIADGASPELLPLFGGNHWYNPVGRIVGGSDMRMAYAEFTAQCEEAGVVSVATIIPGYDDSNIGRTSPTVADREAGHLYMRSWAQALASGADWIAITSFNEWHEGSEIEASAENGTLYGSITAHFSRFFHARAKADREYDFDLYGDLDMIQVRPMGSSLYELINYDARPRVIGARDVAANEVLGVLGVISPEEQTAGELMRRPFGLGWPVTLDSEEERGGALLEIPPFGIAQVGSVDALQTGADPNLLEESGRDLLERGIGIQLESAWSSGGMLRAFSGAKMPVEIRIGRPMQSLAACTLELSVGDSEPSVFSITEKMAGQFEDLTAGIEIPAGQSESENALLNLHLQWRDGGAEHSVAAARAIALESPFEAELRGAPVGQEAPALTLYIKKRFEGTPLPGIAVMPGQPKVLFPVGTVAALSLGADEWTRELVFPVADDPRLRALKPPVKASFTIRWNDYEMLPSGYVFIGGIFGSEPVDYGLSVVTAEDGVPEILERGCRMTPNPHGSVNYLYFDAIDGTAPMGRTLIVIDYVDRGTGTVGIQYDSADFSLPDHDGAYKTGPAFMLTDTGDIKRFRAYLDDMLFASRQNSGADFRLISDQLLEVQRIMLRKW